MKMSLMLARAKGTVSEMNIRRSLSDFVLLNRLRLQRKFRAFAEGINYLSVNPAEQEFFFIVSCERNAGEAAVKCLESVYSQRYEHRLVRHLFIDDASTDDTDQIIRSWLQCHPDHNVDYRRLEQRQGGTANTVFGIKLAPDDAIVVELNGDDWLADKKVLRFLNKVYSDNYVWMTYNTLRFYKGAPAVWVHEVPRQVVETNSFREYDGWISSALHSFRKKLFNHLDDDTFIDPETGEFWESADDVALYLGMLELAGYHSKHLNRVTYIYNFHEDSHFFKDSSGSKTREKCIRQLKKYLPLEKL